MNYQKKRDMGRDFGSDFTINHADDELIFIVDLNLGGRSVTNDAENVLMRIDAAVENGIGGRRVFYRDSMRQIDEILHDNGRFLGFKSIPYGDPLLKRIAK